MIKYDLILPLGLACSSSQTVREANLQLLSFPYDWVRPMFTDQDRLAHEIRERAEFLCNGFADWLRPEDFQFQHPLQMTRKDLYVNPRLNLVFNHDFPTGVPFETAFPDVRAKYRRRAGRLTALLRRARSVLIVRVDRPDLDIPTSVEDCQYVRRRLKEAYPQATFDFFLFTMERGRSFADRRVETVEPGFTRVSFDYQAKGAGHEPYQPDLRQTAAVLRERFAVRDYRTREERRQYDAQRRAKRLAREGVNSLVELHWKRISRVVRRPADWFRALMARSRQKKFDHVVVLGCACETAFRFYRRWGFLDSSLFAWANSRNLVTLTAALHDLPFVCSGALTFEPRSRMWHCENSDIYFHGRLAPGATMPGEDALAEDQAELRSRIGHLREKLLRCAADNSRTLYAYMLDRKDAESPALLHDLSALEHELAGVTHGEWTLLIICERRFRKRLPPDGGHLAVRTVAEFNPRSDAVNPKTGDSAGWDAVFTEFAPAVILPKAHAFKFE